MNGCPQATKNQAPPLLVSCNEAARLLGISRQTLEKLIYVGDVPSIVLRRRRLIPRDFLEQLARGLEENF
jgi:excisionase family DNA binding protein